MQAIIIVIVLPPSESFKSQVSFESQYGTNDPALFLSLRILIQFPRARRDLFMFAPSTYHYPVLFAIAALSDPAKSIRDNFELVTF